MNHFLENILNPIPARKKRTQTQVNSGNEITKNLSNTFQNGEKSRFDQVNSQQSQQNGGCDDYERQEVTQQIDFDHGSEHQVVKNPNMQSSYSQGVLREVRKVKIVNGGYKGSNELRSNQFFLKHSKIQKESNLYEASSNDKKVQQIKKSMSNKIVEQLIEGINSAKDAQDQFLLWFSQEKSNFDKLIKILEIKFHNKIKQVVQRMRQQSLLYAQNATKSQQTEPKVSQKQSVLSTEQRWQIQKKLIKQELQQRYLYRIQKLEQQLQQKRHQQQEIHQKDSQNHQQNQNFHEIQRLNEGLEILKFQLNQKNTLIAELQIENQKLNQHIFDVEQKISGIQLEVENKVREKIKEFQQENLHNPIIKEAQTLNPILEASSQLEQSSRAIGSQSLHINSLKIDELVSINEMLKQKLQEAQFEKDQFQNQFKEHEKILSFREQQIQKNQQDINFEWIDIEKQRQSLLQREQQLTAAEENISKKISQIRYKQAQFQKWQTQLQTRQANLDLKDQEFNKKLEELVEHENIFKFEKEKFIKEKQVFSNNTKSRKNILQFNTQSIPLRVNDADAHQIPMTKKYYYEQDLKHQRSFENLYQFKNKNQFMKNNLQRSYEEDKSYTRQNRDRQRAILTGNNYNRPPTRQSHQFILPQSNSRLQNQSRSKSKSKERIPLRNNLLPSSIVSGSKNVQYKSNTRFSEEITQNKQAPNLNGLGSKLQRLRDEIKKQIDSIK